MHARRVDLIRRTAALAVVALLGLAACNDESGRSDGSPLSKSAFVEEANRICRASRAEAAQIAAPSLADPAAVQQAIAQSAAIQREALRELRALEPPEADVPGIEGWLELVAGTIRQMDKVREGLADGDGDAVNAAIDRGTALASDAEEFADAYGIGNCSSTVLE